MGCRSIGKNFNCSDSVIDRILKENKIDHSKNSPPRTHTVNENFFEVIDNPIKAYWLGVLYADGSVYKTTTKLTQKPTDGGLEFLQMFLDDIDSNHKIITCEQVSWGTKTVISYCPIYSAKMVRDLIDKRCIPNKSLLLQFPSTEKVPEEFQRDLIRGYFDGDGSIIVGNSSPSMNFTGTYEFLSVVREKLGIISKVKKDTRTEGNTYVLTTRGTPIITRTFHYLYDDAERYLERKYNKFLKCIK